MVSAPNKIGAARAEAKPAATITRKLTFISKTVPTDAAGVNHETFSLGWFGL
jgi:hypothetical protein